MTLSGHRQHVHSPLVSPMNLFVHTRAHSCRRSPSSASCACAYRSVSSAFTSSGGQSLSLASAAREDGCVVEGDCCVVVAVAVLVVCDLEDGIELRALFCFWLIGGLCRLLVGLPGDPLFSGEEGELRLFGVPPLVTSMVVRLSSLLPRLELG